MNLIHMIALLLLVPAFLMASNTVVCNRSGEDDAWSFSPGSEPCDGAYLTIIVAFCAVMIFLLIQKLTSDA